MTTENEWIDHNGRRNPAPGARVDVRYLDGTEDRGESNCFIWRSVKRDASKFVPIQYRIVGRPS